MPEGDTIHRAAERIREVLEQRVPEEILTPQPRHRADRWPERLRGRAVRAVEIWMDHTIAIPMLFDPGHNLDERILREQFGY